MASLPIQQMSLVDAALEYASRGKPVFPCDPSNKRPLVPNGFKDASSDPIQIRAWWARWPQAMIGMPTGRVTGVWVLDVDDVAAFEAACDMALPTTAKVMTGKGYHLYFVWDDEAPVFNAQQKVVSGQKVWPFHSLPGAEVRGEGGYVILPPSWHPSGRQYSWAPDQEPCEAPAELLDIVRKKAEPAAAETPQASSGVNTPYGMKALQEECAAILTAPMGTQEGTLNSAALKIGGLVAGSALDHQFAASRLVSAGMMMPSHNERDPWTAQKVAAKVESAMRDGMANPRTAPPRALTSGDGHSGKQDHKQVKPAQVQSEPCMITPTLYVARDPATIAPRDWKYGHWLLGGAVTGAVAVGGIGKSTFFAGTALALVTGRSLYNKKVWLGPKRVWIWNLEDPMEELDRSLSAGMLHFNVHAGDIGDRLYVDTAIDGKRLCTAIMVGNEVKVLAPVYEAIVAALKSRKIDVLIIDPFVSSHMVDENSNTAIDAIAKEWVAVAAATGCCIILVHHVSKAGAGEVTAMSGRGAVAMINACRAVLVFNRMTKEDASKVGVEADETWRYFSVHDDKHNRAPAEKAEWFRLASVDLGNETADRPSDVLGVAAPWSPPDPFENVSPNHLRMVQALIETDLWRQSSQSPAWAGFAVAKVFGFSIVQEDGKLRFEKAAEKSRATRLLSSWIENDALRIEEDKEPGSRKQVKFVRVGQPCVDGVAPPARGGAAQGGAVAQQQALHHPTPPKGWVGGAVVRKGRDQVEHHFGGAASDLDEDDPAADAYDGPRTRF